MENANLALKLRALHLSRVELQQRSRLWLGPFASGLAPSSDVGPLQGLHCSGAMVSTLLSAGFEQLRILKGNFLILMENMKYVPFS